MIQIYVGDSKGKTVINRIKYSAADYEHKVLFMTLL